jgi:hypothetical protein
VAVLPQAETGPDRLGVRRMTLGVHTAGHGCGGEPQGGGRHVHAPALVWRPDRPAVSRTCSTYSRATTLAGTSSCRHLPTSRPGQLASRGVFFSIALPVAGIERRRRAFCQSSLGGLGATFLRRCRLQFQSPDHVGCNRSDLAKTHPSVLSSAVVGVEANHDAKEFRDVRTAFRESRNVFRG